ncbi:hypothetical protein ATHL_00006 [Anaerolinea thermolimosa]|uniref:hypothetical protein n=1 Tax=Anaerolinea thermolimosa TaxID=229919 RepID=UPI0007811820|nr:hypothetical protein [Anaerolinea thermolimosa]GAP05176.1 hypothetical protein ATHL_00006 [Anaerolinea thermolimosa]
MTWKHTERAIAKRLNGRRLGATGGATPDVITDRLAVEVKQRKALPEWLKDALAQAVHGAGKHHADDLVLLRLQDLERLLNQQT